VTEGSSENVAERAAAAFEKIVSNAGNREMLWSVRNASARLHRFRLYEPHILPNCAAQLTSTDSAFAGGDDDRLKALIDQYHNERHNVVDRLVAMDRGGFSDRP
jgi:hypothetical protein